MKSKLAVIIAGMLALSVAMAPVASHAQEGQTRATSPVLPDINLTSEQKAQLQQIKEDIRSQMATILSSEQLAQLKSAMENESTGCHAIAAAKDFVFLPQNKRSNSVKIYHPLQLID